MTSKNNYQQVFGVRVFLVGWLACGFGVGFFGLGLCFVVFLFGFFLKRILHFTNYSNETHYVLYTTYLITYVPDDIQSTSC